MIPYTLLMCTLVTSNDTTHELRVLELSPRSFSFRVSKQFSPDTLLHPRSITLSFYQKELDTFESFRLNTYSIQHISQQDTAFWNYYCVTTEDIDFKNHAKDLTNEYLDYISLKMDSEDWELSHELVGWPFSPDSDYPDSLDTQYQLWFQDITPDQHWLSTASQISECALCLDRIDLIEAFLCSDFRTFVTRYWNNFGLSAHPISRLPITHLYIGNQYCPLQSPSYSMLLQVIAKCEALQISPVIVFAPVSEQQLNTRVQLVAQLADHHKKPLELVVNDWGFLCALKEASLLSVSITLGVLMNKQKKDSRMAYTFSPAALQKTLSFDTYGHDGFIETLSTQYQVSASLQEAISRPFPRILSGQRYDLVFPFYQTNTATCCPLEAHARTGSRNAQQQNTVCNYHCARYIFLYPSGSEMVGAYNSLFGLDRSVLADSSYLRTLLTADCRRIVLYFI